MKDYMASGSFARGRDAINAYASMVFVGNIIPTIPGELFAKFQTGFYADASDAVFKALGVG
jgi:predicted ATP-dependent Lon-type protease